MNIYKHELKYNFKSAILWILVLSGLVALMMCFFPAIRNDIEDFTKILNNLPPAVKSIMGVVTQNFSSSLGFYCFVFSYVSLFAAIQAMNLGVGIVSKEVRERTADFLMTKPVSRIKILTSKLISVLTLLIFTNVFFIAVSFFFVKGMSDGNFNGEKFTLISCSLFLLQMIFFSIGLVVSVAAKKIKSVLSVSLGLVFTFFAVSAFAVTADDDKLRFLTPFQYFKAEYIFSKGQYDIKFLIVGLTIVIASIISSYIIYKHKDIHAV